jgi:hypothetical protein
VICACKRFATDPQLVGHIGGRPTLRGPLQIDRAGRVFQTHMARRVSPWESRHHAPRHVTAASAPLEAGAGSAAMTSLGSQVTVWAVCSLLPTAARWSRPHPILGLLRRLLRRDNGRGLPPGLRLWAANRQIGAGSTGDQQYGCQPERGGEGDPAQQDTSG